MDLFRSVGSDTTSLNSTVVAINYCRGYFQVSTKQVLPWWGKFECMQINVFSFPSLILCSYTLGLVSTLEHFAENL